MNREQAKAIRRLANIYREEMGQPLLPEGHELMIQQRSNRQDQISLVLSCVIAGIFVGFFLGMAFGFWVK